ncbi:MAG: hypothetical protein M1514_02355 [Patescibacteria group bacterium]|nr:hypothetical protein [Patescibacteria group bacterium]
MPDFKVGKITHYFDKIGVAVLELTSSLSVGDTIRIDRGSDEVRMTVSSMQIEHEQIQDAQSGQTVGLKVDQPVSEGNEVYKVA